MAITPLPAVPLRSDAPATFVTKADAFLGALNLFATEVDAVGVALTLGATNSTSTTSLLIGVGSKSLTVQTGKSYVAGMTLKIASTATPTTWMLGDITAYTSGTGALVVTVTSLIGSGTLAAWTISQSAPGGAAKGINSDITSLTALDTSILNIGSGQVYKDASGNVGIGTSSPAAVLQIASDASGTDFRSLSTKAGIALNFSGSGISYYDSDTTVFRASTSAGSTEKMRIDPSGNVTLQNNISVGAAAPTTSGTGVTFPATQAASTNANTLDDYEEGVWTPVLTSGFTTTGTPILSGSYTKIGRSVTVYWYVQATTNSVANGAVMSGLPYTTVGGIGLATNSGGTFVPMPTLSAGSTLIFGGVSISTPNLVGSITYITTT